MYDPIMRNHRTSHFHRRSMPRRWCRTPVHHMRMMPMTYASVACRPQSIGPGDCIARALHPGAMPAMQSGDFGETNPIVLGAILARRRHDTVGTRASLHASGVESSDNPCSAKTIPDPRAKFAVPDRPGIGVQRHGIAAQIDGDAARNRGKLAKYPVVFPVRRDWPPTPIRAPPIDAPLTRRGESNHPLRSPPRAPPCPRCRTPADNARSPPASRSPSWGCPRA
jgi:hypothetical protein